MDSDTDRQKAGDESAYADTGIESATEDMGAESVKSSALSGKIIYIYNYFQYQILIHNFTQNFISQRRWGGWNW